MHYSPFFWKRREPKPFEVPEEELEVEFGWVSAQMPHFVVMGVGKKLVVVGWSTKLAVLMKTRPIEPWP